jgi:MFS family permease
MYSAMLPFVFLLLCLPKRLPPKHDETISPTIPLDDSDVPATITTQHPTIKFTLLSLLSNAVYVEVVFGYAALSFVIGVLGLFMPKYISEHLSIDTATSAVAFGACTAGAGIVGTALGGLLADRGRRTGARRVLHLLRLVRCFHRFVAYAFAVCALKRRACVD